MPVPHGLPGRLHRLMRLVGLTVLVFAAAGCDGRRTPVPVSGTVTLDGRPVEGAIVTFHLVGDDKEGRPATGQTDKAGTFRLTTGNEDGARAGEYKVVIVKNVLPSPKVKMPDFPDTPEGRNQREHFLWKQFGDDQLPYRNMLPERYADLKSTPLTCKVPGDSPVHFPLTSK
ncbi:MAG TPA: carboxypeptidase-like regulatory domain-containing protein [Gemmataceae bacterium]|nr:carboxypeptidase-like regulatory domain-containing protein [Gemmataceae bacterium]